MKTKEKIFALTFGHSKALISQYDLETCKLSRGPYVVIIC